MRFKTMWRNQNLHVASALGIQKETLGNHVFSEIIKLQLGKKNAMHCFVFYCFYCCLIISKNCMVPPILLLDFNSEVEVSLTCHKPHGFFQVFSPFIFFHQFSSFFFHL